MLKTYHITTFGCQMNERDSERISGFLDCKGFMPADEKDAGLIIINTCTVRENANNKLYGHLGHLKSLKEMNPELKIALCGCMMQESGVKENIKKKYPFVDLIFGTGNIEKFPELLELILRKEKVYDTDTFVSDDNINVNHKFPFKSGVNIMFGCNNFCSYCIVPYVRGRERSRRHDVILKEINALCNDGVSEVMLLGQNVNSYGKTLDDNIDFSDLLNEVSKIESVKRIRFMTSHPKDLSDKLIQTIADNEKICNHIHLPLQSGSSRILEKMNRHYTKEHYLSLIDKIRTNIPDIAITTDIIVGFPGEDIHDVNETIDVIKKAEFDSAFTFVYSKRSGTPAAKLVDDTDEQEIKRRFDMVLDAVHEVSKKRTKLIEGNTERVLVESINQKDPTLVTGRMDKNFTVHFKGDESLVGKYVDVYIKESKGFYFLGEKKCIHT